MASANVVGGRSPTFEEKDVVAQEAMEARVIAETNKHAEEDITKQTTALQK